MEQHRWKPQASSGHRLHSPPILHPPANADSVLSQICPLASSPPSPLLSKPLSLISPCNSFHPALTSTQSLLIPFAPWFHTWKHVTLTLPSSSHPRQTAWSLPSDSGPPSGPPDWPHLPFQPHLTLLALALCMLVTPFPHPHIAPSCPLFCWEPCWWLFLLRQADSALLSYINHPPQECLH